VRGSARRITAFEESGAYIFGRLTYEITNGWGGSHPVNGAPTFVLTSHPPAEYPRGPSNLTFVTDGIESAIRQAREVAGGKDIKLGGASPGQQALSAGVCDEILIHLAPYLLGDGVRLFDRLPAGTRLEKLSVSDGPLATHLRYRVIYEPAP
jgi:dihydrofolate reductase